jgi:DNA repair protein RecO (recombination protein O)
MTGKGMEKTNAVVIRTADFKDADRMLTLLTKDFGLVSAKVKSAKKQTSKLFCGSNLFCCGEYEFYEKNGYYGVRGCSITHSFQKLAEDYDAYSAACFIADATGKVAQEQYPAPKLFALVVNALFALETAIEPDTVICYFIQRLLYIEGLYPNIDECVLCGNSETPFFSAEQGGMLCSQCAKSHNSERIGVNVMEPLRAMAGVVPRDIGKVRIDKEAAGRLKRLLISYLENAMMGPLKASKYIKA